MKKYLVLLFLFISFIVFAADYDLTVKILENSKVILGTMKVHLSDNEDPYFALFPNLESKDNPYINALFESKRKSKIEILEVKDENNNYLDYTIEDYSSKRFRDYQIKNSLLKVKSKEKTLIIKFKTYLFDGNAPDNVFFDDIIIWRFGWYPLIFDRNTDYSLSSHNVSIQFENLNKKFIPIISGIYKKGIYYSYGKYRTMPLILANKNSYKNLTLNTKNYEINVWFRKGQEQRAAIMATHVIKALELHTKDFGELKYKKINIVQDPYPGVYGMAADGIFLLGDGFFTTADLVLPGLFEPLTFYVISHELAHMWFGIGVGVDFANNNFMSESLADYSAHISMYEKYDDDRLYNTFLPDILVENITKDITKDFSELDQAAIFKLGYYNIENAIKDNIDEIPANFASYIYYNKGKRALFSLEEYLSRKKLLNILSEYYYEYKDKNPTEEEFFDFLSKYVEKDILYDLFENPKSFDASVKRIKDKIIIDLDNMKIPTKIRIITEDGTKEIITTKNIELEYDPSIKIDIDPEMHTFDIERHNNHFPIQIRNNLFDTDISKYDAYGINIIGNFDYTENYSSQYLSLSFEKYPYYNIDFGQYSTFSSDYNLVDMGLTTNLNLNPNPWINLKLNYLKSYYFDMQDLNGNFMLSIPNELDIGESSKVIASTTHFGFYGQFLESNNYYLSPYLIFENLYNLGLYFAGQYYFMNSLNNYIHAFSFNTAYFFDNYSPILNSFSIELDYSNNYVFNPLYGKVSLIKENDELLNNLSLAKQILGINIELLNFSDNSNKRMNFYNLFSVGDIDTTLSLIYKNVDFNNLFGFSFVISPEIYFLLDQNIPINLEFNYYYYPKSNLYTITFSLNTALDTTIRNIIN
ncbi:Peptidase family M1 [Marinitoga hydrogenitolerans DSM 16785]|uniref:Peptidase family M1 n=1 Tax=Marinitoga hydrogenitolerans (strain DSM 16785 / JCM 12826 / AT1271) TaxID=1122195 RepID=A0A1M4W681_MARH1|nr:M1 family aminopeptidase [Marinitoga hydrogenitolerans]SHE76660.1 Peptidase family M1 [Marinitoga hydrogenitolerans DSM 16785]